MTDLFDLNSTIPNVDLYLKCYLVSFLSSISSSSLRRWSTSLVLMPRLSRYLKLNSKVDILLELITFLVFCQKFRIYKMAEITQLTWAMSFNVNMVMWLISKFKYYLMINMFVQEITNPPTEDPDYGHCFFKNGPIPASFRLFSLFSRYNFNTNWKSIDGVLGIWTRGEGW